MGFEPADDFGVNRSDVCSCDFCQGFRAANALHSRRSRGLSLASNDPDLQQVGAVWRALPDAIRTAVITLVSTVAPPSEGSYLFVHEARQRDWDETAWRIARACREIIQSCLREEEWHDADREFYTVIRGEIRGDIPFRA